MIELERKGRISDFEWDRNRPIFAVCDVGTSDPFSVWLVQTDGREIDIIYSYEDDKGGRTATFFINMMADLGFPIRRWILPWDAQPQNSTIGWLTDFKKAGAMDVQRLKKYNNSRRMQIDYMLTMFPRIRFRRSATQDGRVAISAYSWEEASPGQLKPAPEHNWASHYGSSFGYIGEAEKMGLLRASLPQNAQRLDEPYRKPKKFTLKKC